MNAVIKAILAINITLIVLGILPIAFPNVFYLAWAALGVNL